MSDRTFDRSVGLEQEFFLVERSGRISERADEFLERCAERTGADGPDCMAPEFVKGLVEINTPPVRGLAGLEAAYAENLGLALDAARAAGLRLYPLGTYPLPLEPIVRDEPDYQVQVRTVGTARFMDAGRCAGTHLHLALAPGVVDVGSGVDTNAPEEDRRELVDLYNLATALDPALILLTRSSPFFEGRATGLASRPARYRGSAAFGWEGVYKDLPAVGALQPYAKDPAHLARQQFDRLDAWLGAMDRAGVDRGLFEEAGGDLLRPAWNPVRLNRQGTLELRGLDSNLPDTTLTAAALVLAAAGRVRREGLVVTPDDGAPAFRVSGGRLLVPDFARLGGSLLHAAVAGTTRDPTSTAYLDSVLKFTGAPDSRLETLRRTRHAQGFYPSTEDAALGLGRPANGRLSEAEGLRVVLWACDELEAQLSRLSCALPRSRSRSRSRSLSRASEGEPAGTL